MDMTHLPKSVESHLNTSANFNSSRTFKNRTNSEISQNSRSIAVLLVSVLSLKPIILTPKLTLTFCFVTLYAALIKNVHNNCTLIKLSIDPYLSHNISRFFRLGHGQNIIHIIS